MYCFKRTYFYYLLAAFVFVLFLFFAQFILSKRTSTTTRASSPYIVGGTKVLSAKDYPFMAGLLDTNYLVSFEKQDNLRYEAKDAFFCGGSLINETWVVTAAHCVNHISRFDSIQILTNTISLSGEIPARSKDEYLHAVEDIIIHPQYDEETSDNDIALIMLADKASLTSTFVQIPPDTQYYADGKTVRATGWGDQIYKGDTSTSLYYVDLPIIPSSKANWSKWYNGQVTANMIAAGHVGKDTCQGDSGGPLFYTEGESFYLVGITSWGEGCGDVRKPGVYTKVINYKKWITDELAKYAPTPKGLFKIK